MVVSLENGVGIVKTNDLVGGEFVLPGNCHIIVEDIDILNDIHSVKLVDDELESEGDLEWILEMAKCGKAKLVA